MVIISSGAFSTIWESFCSCLVNQYSPKWMVKPSCLSSRSPCHSCFIHLSADERGSDGTEEVQSMFVNLFLSRLLTSWLSRKGDAYLPYFSSITPHFIWDPDLGKLVYSLPHLYFLMFKVLLLIIQPTTNKHKNLSYTHEKNKS